jgi:hypothetical protein
MAQGAKVDFEYMYLKSCHSIPCISKVATPTINDQLVTYGMFHNFNDKTLQIPHSLNTNQFEILDWFMHR